MGSLVAAAAANDNCGFSLYIYIRANTSILISGGGLLLVAAERANEEMFSFGVLLYFRLLVVNTISGCSSTFCRLRCVR